MDEGRLMDETPGMIASELPRLRRWARALRDEAGAEDLVQDCVERALRKRGLFEPGTNLRAWLFRILYNLHLSSLRHDRRAPTPLPLDDLPAAAVEKASQLPAVELNELSHAMADLPRDQREVLTLVALDGLRYDEAADVLGINIGTVRSRLSRGRASLRETLAGRIVTDERPRLRRVK